MNFPSGRPWQRGSSRKNAVEDIPIKLLVVSGVSL